jgi:hypothetical protein
LLAAATTSAGWVGHDVVSRAKVENWFVRHTRATVEAVPGRLLTPRERFTTNSGPLDLQANRAKLIQEAVASIPVAVLTKALLTRGFS